MFDFATAEYSAVGCFLIDSRCLPTLGNALVPRRRSQVNRAERPLQRLASWRITASQLTP